MSMEDSVKWHWARCPECSKPREDSDHSKRSPSGADFWGNCPGGSEFVKARGLTRSSGVAADWGTMCHCISKTAIAFSIGKSQVPPEFPPGDEAAREVVQFYVAEVLLPTDPLCDCNPLSLVMAFEERGESRHLPHSSGTLDAVVYCPVHLWIRVADLKTGHGEVEAIDNPQLAIYGLLKMLAGGFRVSRMVLDIIQPRSPTGRKVKRWELRAVDLLEWLPVFQAKVAASLAPDAPLVAGEKQCKYCPAAGGLCPEREKMKTEVARIQFGIEKGPKAMLPERVAEALKLIPQLKDWIKNVESTGYQMANNGVKIPGFKLVNKQLGNRKWENEADALTALFAVVGKDALTDPELKSPAQLEKDKRVGKELVNSLCIREPGGTVLVEESSDRPEVVVNKLATFEALITRTN